MVFLQQRQLYLLLPQWLLMKAPSVFSHWKPGTMPVFFIGSDSERHNHIGCWLLPHVCLHLCMCCLIHWLCWRRKEWFFLLVGSLYFSFGGRGVCEALPPQLHVPVLLQKHPECDFFQQSKGYKHVYHRMDYAQSLKLLGNKRKQVSSILMGFCYSMFICKLKSIYGTN